MRLFKSLALAAAVATVAGQAIAGGFAPVVPAPEPVVVVEPTAPRSSFGIILPLVLLGGLVGTSLVALNLPAVLGSLGVESPWLPALTAGAVAAGLILSGMGVRRARRNRAILATGHESMIASPAL